MKTVRERETNVRTIIYNLINVYQPYPKLITEHKEAIDQALKEIDEVILDSLPEEKEQYTYGHTAEGEFRVIGYNQALEDTRKAIKEVSK